MEQSKDSDEWLTFVVHYDETAVAPPKRISETKPLDNACAHWALAFGLISLVPTVSMVTLPISLPFAVLALVLGTIGLRTADRTNDRGRRRSIVGMCAAAAPIGMFLATSILALVVAVVH